MKKSFFLYPIFFLLTGLEVVAQSSVLIEPNGANGILSKNSSGLTASSNNTTNPPVAPVSGQGTRLMWIPSRSAFRVGTAESTEWNASEIGLFSMGLGYGTLAKGKYSMALGAYSGADKDYAVAMGNNAYANGFNSLAFGSSTLATGHYATVMGVSSSATGNTATAMGRFTKAQGWAATALGDSTLASGNSSTAMGYGTTASGDRSTAIGGFSVASGFRSVAAGAYSNASGENALAAGWQAEASGYTAISLGYNTTAGNNYTVAIGASSSATAVNATTIGFGNLASGENSTAMGFNASTSGRLRSFAIGGHSSNATPQVANTADYQMMMAFHNYRFWTQNGGKYVDFGPNGEVTATGAYTNISDRRLKKDPKPLTNSLSKLLKTNTYHYYWKSDTTSKDLQTGVIAQEIRELFPELVHEDDKGMLSVNYVGLVPHLIEAVKELKKENEAMKMGNTELMGRFSKLERQIESLIHSTTK
ncbi:tail fiber domain-containing protein [Runella sp. SP2]|uniref:tail fiber domain-containing protein n=1 Tax=Runella sp. SP2 TaxID=2268026 RepID=UPI000F081E22|nr:tail fiber domain-containing protein [Runella sp. SP2]AYQ32204.1 hypothetical protein DTQ70_08450 [Runella sp. SP2]